MPAGHESPSGVFKPQTGLRSKCRVFSAARSQRFRRAGSDGLRHPASASCLGRHSHPAGRCPNSSSLYPPLAAVVAVANKGLLAPFNPKEDGLHTKKLAASLNAFCVPPFQGPSAAAAAAPRRGAGAPSPSAPVGRSHLSQRERQEALLSCPWLPLRGSWREAPERVRSPAGSQHQQMLSAIAAPPVKKQRRKARRLFSFANQK